jgi:superfamily II DNA or RNA helicase
VASVAEFQSKILRREHAPGEYRLYRAALEWGLLDPIVIESRKDFKSENRWRERLEPYHHQVTNLITFCRRLPVTLLADDVGLGKTISAGLVASELIARSRMSKMLIVCPKLLGPQWRDELQVKFDIQADIVTGKDLIEAESKDPGAIITTYNSARLYLDRIPDDRFEMLILDEAHKLRNLYGVEKPPQVAVRFREALEKRRFRYVLMLTATPIQNRLWDLYSLVDLLTVARGHANPFGSEGMFARKFIADKREHARQLKPEARDEFRSIVYGYMSRVRRGDAKLYFPERVVQLHKVQPTAEELELIRVIAKPIQKLNRLAQISILFALTSSPHALMAQLNAMARNGTVTNELAATVHGIVGRMGLSAKLQGLGALAERLRRENPAKWRLVVFTGRLETQTTIQAYLESQGISVGIINGASGPKNQTTLARFRKDRPEVHVIVSTEAGSEGLNLQVANVVANYDLPWNPMVVEQRIGRVQRLASNHAKVSIFNITLKGTFEEYIVGRLMEKLQMASHAIGDIEALLQGSGLGEDSDGDSGFDDKILQLVLAALADRDVEAATRQAEQSIANAKAELEREEANINTMLGSMDGAEYVGPRAPNLPPVNRSMEGREFVLAALASLGARVTPQGGEIYLTEQDRGREFIRFEDSESTDGPRATLYAPGSGAFARLVDKVAATGVHTVEDVDREPETGAIDVAREWIAQCGATLVGTEVEDVSRSFEGEALVRVRATVAHDSYERLVGISCAAVTHRLWGGRKGLNSVPQVIQEPAALGVNSDALSEAASKDPAISEFCRFYLERRAQEVSSAGSEARKKKKLEDDFTPRLQKTLVALEGSVHRQLKLRMRYRWDSGPEYVSTIIVEPHGSVVVDAPPLAECAKSGQLAPKDCLERCEMSGAEVLRHLLVRSDISGRYALPEHAFTCHASKQTILSDEAELSDISGEAVARSYLKTSAVSGKRGEPEYFAQCEFTQTDVLLSELGTSEISGKRYRLDQEARSVVSDKAGHRREFVPCRETRQPLAPKEGERCEVTGHIVRPGVLERCAVTGKMVLPSELEQCAATGKRALKKLLVTSSLSHTRILERYAVRSAVGRFCAPLEAKRCMWSGRKCHPDDLRTCTLTGVQVHFEFVTSDSAARLQPLSDLLYGVRRGADGSEVWDTIAAKASAALGGGRCRLEAAQTSPDGRHLAVCSEVRKFFGLQVNQAGLLYSLNDNEIVGHIAVGKRNGQGWTATGRAV